jgi:hypothetical protein
VHCLKTASWQLTRAHLQCGLVLRLCTSLGEERIHLICSVTGREQRREIAHEAERCQCQAVQQLTTTNAT